jgi:hypothetical protein
MNSSEIRFSEIYKLDMDSPQNEPFYYYTYGGRGMHEGLSETDRYIILAQVPGDDCYVFLNINTGMAVKGVQTLNRFKLA